MEKPDESIFLEALRIAACAPSDAIMIGDRLDNDIYPAIKLGMKTIWVKQGCGRYGDPGFLPVPPDTVVEHIIEIEKIFL